MHDYFSKIPAIVKVRRNLLESVQRINAHLKIKKKLESLQMLNIKLFSSMCL